MGDEVINLEDAEGELDELDANSTGDQPELDADEDDDGLPYPWVRLVDEDGPYYYNEETGEAHCELPFPEDDVEMLEPLEFEWEKDLEQPYGCQPQLRFREVVAGPEASQVRVTLATDEWKAAMVGTQVTLSFTEAVLFRIKEAEQLWSEGEGHAISFVLEAVDPGWRLEAAEYEGTLRVLLAASDLEEAVFSAIHALEAGREVSAWESVDILSHIQDNFPQIFAEMLEDDMQLLLAGSALFQVIEDGTQRVLPRCRASPLEESVQRLFHIHRSRYPGEATESWGFVLGELAKVLGYRDPELDRALLQPSPLLRFAFSEAESDEVVTLRQKLPKRDAGKEDLKPKPNGDRDKRHGENGENGERQTRRRRSPRLEGTPGTPAQAERDRRPRRLPDTSSLRGKRSSRERRSPKASGCAFGSRAV
ncbi:unnamed protein product [Effrenium voratum]|uniref:WW domain-containing protein n=1 Tax=Effrenium voratum TaxID=2562239 RepID=A0AA36NK43_9DINO|nr:unnamed protein product [Effrenium voratum]